MNGAQVFPLVTETRYKMHKAKKGKNETMKNFINRMLGYKKILVDAGEVFPNDSDVIGWILAALDHDTYGTVQDLVTNNHQARTEIRYLLPILYNKEAMLRVSKQRFDTQDGDNQKSVKKMKTEYGMFGTYAHRGGGRNTRGRGRNTYGGRSTYVPYSNKRCWVCNSTEHLSFDCPNKHASQPALPAASSAPSVPSHRGGRGHSFRGGRGGRHSHRGGHTMMHAYAYKDEGEREHSAPKRLRVDEEHNTYIPAPAAAEGPHALPWRE